MSGRTVLVTGAARGIGKGIAKSFLEHGDNVVAADLPSKSDWNYDLATENELNDTAEELASIGNVRHTPADVTDFSSCQQAIANCVEHFGGVDVLVNNAGVVGSGPIEHFEERTWDHIFDVNVKGIYLMIKSAISTLRRSDNPAIVNVASIAGKRGSANMSCYCASKFAVVGLTQSLAHEFAADGIRVNAVCPGIVGTAMWFDHLMANRGEQAFEDRMKRNIPLQRPQTVEDIGEAVVYLANAKNVSGIALNVAGGLEMH